MSKILFANNAQTTLAGGISNVATTANLAPGSGALFPSPGAGQYFCLTFSDAATGLLLEIVHVTGVSGDTITMVRGQEGTTALAWLAGDHADNRLTATTAAAFAQLATDNTFTGLVTAPNFNTMFGTTSLISSGVWTDLFTPATSGGTAAVYIVAAQTGNGYGSTCRVMVGELTFTIIDHYEQQPTGPVFRISGGKLQAQQTMGTLQPIVWVAQCVGNQ